MTSNPPFLVELSYENDSITLFEKIKHLKWPVFLDSAGTGAENGRYDIITAEPFITYETRGQQTDIQTSGNTKQSPDDPFELIERTLSQYLQPSTHLPFIGGAVGYFGYDLGRRIEHLPSLAEDAEAIPDMAVGIYDWAIIVDHEQKQCVLASYCLQPDTPKLLSSLQALIDVPASQTTSTFHLNGELKCNFPEQAYYQAFDKIQHYIREGDCYQVNLAKRYEIETLGEPWEAYQRLRHLNAAPFSAYFSTENLTVMSSSPERLLKVKDQQVETKPIKGTRRRDLTDPQKDKAMADALQKSLKDRAENLMIVDLLRNDLGKVCKPGSIQVPKPFELESFATVHHLVSTITGTLAEKASAIALLRACFPGGSITGAPKLRAMEIIEELEPHRRGVYCGSIGYIGFDGNMDSNITIRTLVHSENRLRFWAGGGIVADSHADEEYQEAHDKAAAMIALIDSFSDS